MLPPLTMWALAVLVLGGALYLAVSRSNSPTSLSRRRERRPGWIARRRAGRGLRHPHGRIAVGCRSALGVVHLTLAELAGHGLAVGGPKSGKTTLVRLFIEAMAGRVPVFIVDAKGSPALAETVRAFGGMVWTLDGKVPADLLDPRPPLVAEQLLEDENYAGDARAYGDSAHQRALWAAWSLALDGRPMDLGELRRRLDRATLIAALERHRVRDARIGQWLRRLEHPQAIEDAGARDLDRVLGNLLDGVALGGSLRTCPEAIRLEDVMESNGLVLFQLSESQYPHATRKVAAWVLLGMSRLAHQLPPNPDPNMPRALLIVDEVGALGTAARHLRGLVGRAREAGLAVVMTTQGLTDLEGVDRTLVHQVLQDTSWQLAFRQGSPRDADLMQVLFGQVWVEDVMHYSDGRSSTRLVERPRVPIDEWMNGLEPGDGWLRVAPIDGRWREERVRVAQPRWVELGPEVRKQVSETGLGNTLGNHVRPEPGGVSDAGVSDAPGDGTWADMPRGELRRAPRGLPAVPPDCPPELVEKMGADVLGKVERRWSRRHHELGPCLVWREGEPAIQSAGNMYGRLYDPAIKRSDAAHRVVWRRVFGPIPKGRDGKPLEVDHLCEVTLCQRPDHLTLRTKRDNVQRRGPTRGPNKRPLAAAEVQPTIGNRAAAKKTFAIALFVGVNQPAVQPRAVDLNELVDLLNRFKILEDKRSGRCWSPTKYADGASSRGNAGVESVSCLVFDCDRVPPDEERLSGVYWIAHTTHSHTPMAPRWRVVVPLSRPVSAKRWTNVWLCARAALCPEADPACKDPSRAYWLPSRPAGVAPECCHHPGPLLDPRTLPELPPEQRPIRRTWTKRLIHQASQEMRRRGEAYMARVIGNLTAMAPNSGRNVALNKAASALGEWVAAGVLDQAEVEDALYDAASSNGLVADDGQRQCWATIRSGLRHGLERPFDLDNGHHA